MTRNLFVQCSKPEAILFASIRTCVLRLCNYSGFYSTWKKNFHIQFFLFCFKIRFIYLRITKTMLIWRCTLNKTINSKRARIEVTDFMLFGLKKIIKYWHILWVELTFLFSHQILIIENLFIAWMGVQCNG